MVVAAAALDMVWPASAMGVGRMAKAAKAEVAVALLDRPMAHWVEI